MMGMKRELNDLRDGLNEIKGLLKKLIHSYAYFVEGDAVFSRSHCIFCKICALVRYCCGAVIRGDEGEV